MENIKFDTSEVLLRLSKLDVNKSAGSDDIFPRILYEAKEQLAYPINVTG